MKSFATIGVALLAALTLAASSTNAQTNAPSSSTNKAPAAAAKPKAKRYAGTIASVDKDAKTITITLASGASQTLHITSKTKITKDGEPGVFADAVAGKRVKGSERQDDSGNWVAGTVNIGEKPKAAAPAAAEKQ